MIHWFGEESHIRISEMTEWGCGRAQGHLLSGVSAGWLDLSLKSSVQISPATLVSVRHISCHKSASGVTTVDRFVFFG